MSSYNKTLRTQTYNLLMTCNRSKEEEGEDGDKIEMSPASYVLCEMTKFGHNN